MKKGFKDNGQRHKTKGLGPEKQRLLGDEFSLLLCASRETCSCPHSQRCTSRLWLFVSSGLDAPRSGPPCCPWAGTIFLRLCVPGPSVVADTSLVLSKPRWRDCAAWVQEGLQTQSMLGVFGGSLVVQGCPLHSPSATGVPGCLWTWPNTKL